MVGIAGPGTNLLIALVVSLIIRYVPGISIDLGIFLGIIVFANIILGIFNLIPIPPLDGSKVLYAILPARFVKVQEILDKYGFFILLFIIIFGGGFLFSIILFFALLFLGDFAFITLDALT